jgi:antitoxin CptB
MGEESAKMRLSWQCRRGMLELDLLLQAFVQHGYEELDPTARTAFRTLLDYPDAVLLEMLMGRTVTADPEIARVIERIRATAAH